MSEQWRILVVVDEEDLNRSIVNSLRNDGYFVQGVMSGAEAIRALWAETYNVVVGDLKIAGADDFELTQWLRLYRPQAHTILIAAPGSAELRTQALENGIVSFLEKPLNLHLLKEEINRLLQQTGFSASLESFDLLDVIQIITLSRKNIALVVNTGQESRGVLGFQNGDLIWAEYGTLRGEEAFFALAAYKNGTVSHQPSNEQVTPNVTQPLSRLILKALQYRSKYAEAQQQSSELEAILLPQPDMGIDDRPFQFYGDPLPEMSPSASAGITRNLERATDEPPNKEWWMQTGYIPSVEAEKVEFQFSPAFKEATGSSSGGATGTGDTGNIMPTVVHKTPVGQKLDLPAWLTEQPTQSHIPALPSALRQGSGPLTSMATPAPIPSYHPAPAEWQPPLLVPEQPQHKPLSTETGTMRRISSPEWQPTFDGPGPSRSGALQSLNTPTPHKTQEWPDLPAVRAGSGSLPAYSAVPPQPSPASLTPQMFGNAGLHPTVEQTKRNISAVVAALQTLGYAIPGFVATGIVNMEGQPIAQVAVEDVDLAIMGNYFSKTVQGALLSLELGGWGDYEDTVITSAQYHILLRLVGGGNGSFHVLITTREADPIESLEIMANVEGAIAAAL